MGYEDDLQAYCVEHDVAHLLIAQHFFDTPSVLWALAHGDDVPLHTSVFEEAMAQLLQRYVRANEQPIIGRVDWGELRREALKLLG